MGKSQLVRTEVSYRIDKYDVNTSLEDLIMNQIAYLYVLDSMADWETGYLIAELNSRRYCRKDATHYIVKTVGLTKETVATMGGMQIIPDISINELTTENAGLLILPGGNTWLDKMHIPLLEKVKEFMDADVRVAAICGATMALAQAGFLDNRYHTSNDLQYLKAVCPEYSGEQFYLQEPAVTDGKLVTASSVAPLEFAYQVLKKLDIFLPQTLESWYKLYLTREAKYFYALMESIKPASPDL
jgi:putative intracellular protease/amidase